MTEDWQQDLVDALVEATEAGRVTWLPKMRVLPASGGMRAHGWSSADGGPLPFRVWAAEGPDNLVIYSLTAPERHLAVDDGRLLNAISAAANMEAERLARKATDALRGEAT